MVEGMDFGKDDIKTILPDRRVMGLLEIAEKYPMSTIQEMTDAVPKHDGIDSLSQDQVRIILNRFNIASQSARMSPESWKKIKDLIKKEEKRREIRDLRAERTQKRREERATQHAERSEQLRKEREEQIQKETGERLQYESKSSITRGSEQLGSAGYTWATREKPHYPDVIRGEKKQESAVVTGNNIIGDVQVQMQHSFADGYGNAEPTGAVGSNIVEVVADAGLVHASTVNVTPGEDILWTGESDVQIKPNFAKASLDKPSALAVTNVVIKDIFTSVSRQTGSFFKALKKLRITVVSPYYLLLILLILGIIIWMRTGGFFQSQSLDISLPVSFDNSGE